MIIVKIFFIKFLITQRYNCYILYSNNTLQYHNYYIGSRVSKKQLIQTLTVVFCVCCCSFTMFFVLSFTSSFFFPFLCCFTITYILHSLLLTHCCWLVDGVYRLLVHSFCFFFLPPYTEDCKIGSSFFAVSNQKFLFTLYKYIWLVNDNFVNIREHDILNFNTEERI